MAEAPSQDSASQSPQTTPQPARFPKPVLVFLIATLAVLTVSLLAYRSIPPHTQFGVDFHNLWTFHHCEHRSNPYVVRGADCGDELGRDMVYPPLMYWLMGWSGWFSFEVARVIQMTIIFLGTTLSVYAWSLRDQAVLRDPRWGKRTVDLRKGWLFPSFFAIAMLQLPLLFALERGTNDVYVLLSFAAGLGLLVTGRAMFAALFTGLTFALKFYPAPAAFAVGIGYFLAQRERGRGQHGFSFALVVGVACFAPFALFWSQTLPLVTEILPRYHQIPVVKWVITHGLWPMLEGDPKLALLILVALLITWIAACRRRFLEDDAHYAFAGALAISTYFAQVAHDYTLITVYPLLVLQFLRALRTDASTAFRALVLLGFISMGYRGWYVNLVEERVFLQVAWLLLSGIHASLLVPSFRSASGLHTTETAS